jgi:MFS family permease
LLTALFSADSFQFQYTGISVIPNVLATVAVYFIGGPLSDKVSLFITKRRDGVREAEFHLPNLLMPFVSGILGCFIFGYAGAKNLHWVVILVGSFFIIFGFLTVMTVMTVINVYVVESYPQWAGPVLVNVSSMCIIIAFFLSSQVNMWVMSIGIMGTFAIYAESIIVLSLGIPALWFWGKKIRAWTSPRLEEEASENADELDIKKTVSFESV